MTDEQLDELEAVVRETGHMTKLEAITVLADYRRLRGLERAVRDAMRKLPLGRGWVWRGDATDIAAIGRLLEGEG